MSEREWTPPEPPRYGGFTFDANRDSHRLNAQCRRVRDAMIDGAWRSLAEIETLTGDPQASVSARLRDLRKAAFGRHTVERQYIGDGLWHYRLGNARISMEPRSKPRKAAGYVDPGAP